MTGEKILGRTEDLSWNPPFLIFSIERHGGTVQGSTRAELHEWSVNVETLEATCAAGRFRQLKNASPRLDLKPLADRIVDAFETGKQIGEIKWVCLGKGRVLIGKLIPDTGFKQTIEGRRRRLRRSVTELLGQKGWQPAGTWTYEKPQP